MYSVIKTSLHTSWLYCNHQVHRDFLIIPYRIAVIEISSKLPLNSLTLTDNFLISSGRLLYIIMPEQQGPFWHIFRFVIGWKKLVLPLILRQHISEFLLNKSLLHIINKAIDNMYWDAKGNMLSIRYKNHKVWNPILSSEICWHSVRNFPKKTSPYVING